MAAKIHNEPHANDEELKLSMDNIAEIMNRINETVRKT